MTTGCDTDGNGAAVRWRSRLAELDTAADPGTVAHSEGTVSMSGDERRFIIGTAVPVSTHAYLCDLERAARHAEFEQQMAELRVAEHGIANATDPPSPALAGEDGAITSPHEVLRERRAARVIAAANGSLEDVGLIAAWYARAAELYLRAVLAAARVPTAAELELATYRRWLASQRSGPEDTVSRSAPAQRPADFQPWGGEEPPPIPALEELLTGIDSVDEALRATHHDLISAPSPHGPGASQYLAWARALRAAAEARARDATGPPRRPLLEDD